MKVMKLLGLALVITLCANLTGCFDDDEELEASGPPPEELAAKALAQLKEKPFDPTGWTTNPNAPRYGSKRAVRGGMLKIQMLEYPTTFCPVGPNARHVIISKMEGLIAERLCDADARNNYALCPWIASHWKQSEDKMTLWFRIDPRARFSDGKPVTALDIVESYKLLIDPAIKDPFANSEWKKRYECPVAESRYIVRVKCKSRHWKNLLNFALFLNIFPAHQIMGERAHKKFLRKFNFRYFVGSGPYILEYTLRGREVTFRRRDDWWGDKLERNRGLYNFKRIKFVVIQEENLNFEKFKKGELDFYYCNIARRWATECDFDKIKKGWIQKRQIWNEKPCGIQGYALNTRKPPFNDIRVRKAMFYLYNRQKLIDKLFFNQYVHQDSLWPLSPYASPDNEKIRFNPEKAQQLLAEAGWKKRNEEGILVKDGVPFEITLQYASKSSERIYTVYQEDLKRAGIKLNLKLSTRASAFKMMLEHNFQISQASWNSPRPPSPEDSLHSRYANKKNTSNVCGHANPKVDALIEKYNETFDPKEQIRIMQQIDHLAYENFHYVLDWNAPYHRLLFWNKFGYPEYMFTISGTYCWDMMSLWWIDPEKEKALKQAMKNNTALRQGQLDNKFWIEFRKTRGRNWEELKKVD